MGARDYSTTAASNLAVGDPTVSIAEGWLPASVNNAQRAVLADTAALLLDLGGAVETTGAAGAYEIDLPSAPTAYADNLLFLAKLNHEAPGASTMNVNGLGAKDFKRLVDGVASNMVSSDGPIGHRAVCIYSTADNAILVLNSASAGALYEENGEDVSSGVYNADHLYPAPGGSYEWYNNENVAILEGSLLVADEPTGRTAPYKGDYGGWMPLLYARNYGTTNDLTVTDQQHPLDDEGTPKVYVRGALVRREEDDAIDDAFDRLYFDGSGNLTSPPNPTDPEPVMRQYSRIVGVDHFNVAAAGGTAKAISAINLATGTITTSTDHGLVAGDRCVIAGVGGTIQLNTGGQGYVSAGYIVRTAPSTVTLTLEDMAGVAINMAAWTPWTSGGTVTKAAAHYGFSHPGTGVSGRMTYYQTRYVPAADYATTGRYSGWHEWYCSSVASNDRLPGTPSLELVARLKAPPSETGTTGLWLHVWDGSVSSWPFTAERQVKTKAIGDLDSSDRVLYIDQAEAGVGGMVPLVAATVDNDGATLTVSDHGKTIFASNNVSRAVFTGPASYTSGLRYRFNNGGTAGLRFVVGAGTIRQGGTTGTQVENNPMRDGDSITVEAVSTAVVHIVSMVGTWTVS